MKYNSLTKIQESSNKENDNLFYLDKTSGYYIQNNDILNKDNSLFTSTLLPTEDIPIYCASSHTSLLLFEGNATVFIDNKEIPCFAGNILLFSQGCNLIVKPDDNSKIHLITYKKEFFDTLFLSQIADCPIFYDFFLLKDHKNEFLYFDCDRTMEIQHFVQILLLELNNIDSLSDKTVRCATILFLSNLHRIHRPSLVITESTMMKEYIIGSILKYMADNYSTATLSSTAAHFNYHPAYFSEMFKRKGLCNFSQKMLEIRLEQARRLLVSTDMTIKQICENIGFKEKSYFYRRFKNAYNITPGQYRKKIKPK